MVFLCQSLASNAQTCEFPENGWKALGPIPILKEDVPYQGILVSCEHPKADTNYQQFYVGSNSSGLFYTEDGGYYWRNLSDAAGLIGMGVQDIALCTENPGIILLASGMTTYGKQYGQGLVYTLDHGRSWKVVKAINAKAYTHKIARRAVFLPGSYAAFASVEDELWFCEDIRDESTWKRVWKAMPENSAPGSFYIEELKLHPEFPGVPLLYIACSDPGKDQGGSKIFLLNIQRNFEISPIHLKNVEASARIDIAVSEASPNRLYCILNRPGSNFELLVSDSMGSDWRVQRSLNAYGMGMAGFELEVSPSDPEVLYYGGISFFKQVGIEEGTPRRVQGNIHDDTRDFLILKGSESNAKGSNDILLNANDGGLSINFYGAERPWQSLVGEESFGLNISQFYGIALHPLDTNIISGGLQDNGTMWWDKREKPKHIFGGDGSDCVYDGSQRMIASYNSGASPGKLFSYENARIHSFFKTSFGESNSPIEWSPSNPQKVFYGHSQAGNPPIFDLLALDLQTGELENLSNKGDKAIKAIGLSDADAEILYYANIHVSYDSEPEGIVWRSRNAGKDWTDISKGLEGSKSMRVSSIAVHPADPDILLVSYGGNSPHAKIFLSSNGGSSWEDVSAGLGISGINRLKYSKHGYAFAANDEGLYVFNQAEKNWSCFSKGLPIVPISDIAFDYCNQKIVIASFGRGLWEADYPFASSKSLLTPLVFDKDTVLSSSFSWDGDIRIKNKVQLEMRAEPKDTLRVELGPNSSIILEKKAQLTLVNTSINTRCKQGWNLRYAFSPRSKKVKAKLDIQSSELLKLEESDFNE